MLLWDLEIGPLKEDLREIQAAQRLPLAMKVMEWTLESIGPIEVEVVREYIEEGMRAGHEAVRAGREKITLPEEVLDAYTEVDDEAYEPGTSHMLSALLACADAPGGLTPEVLSGVLSFCYEGLLEREDLPGLSVEEEQQNAKCLEVIAFQKQCIIDALGRAV
ncbi:hypothetical protein [Streptomyces sp. NPDC007904]|jgi:hypothetical protein|uniref:hypothetical protein n=1 Tax=Streptomyces sp. NPDC007904 TaxID=3364787 RepID=UPI0036E609BA